MKNPLISHEILPFENSNRESKRDHDASKHAYKEIEWALIEERSESE